MPANLNVMKDIITIKDLALNVIHLAPHVPQKLIA